MSDQNEIMEKERIRTLRENVIAGMRNLVAEKPDQYDATRLDQAVSLVESTPDDDLDDAIIMNRHMAILCKQVEFTKEEVDRLYEMLRTNFNIVEDVHCNQDERTRDDYQFLLSTSRSPHVVAWVSKTEPSLLDSGDGLYHIEAYGCSIYAMCNLQFNTMDELLAELKSRVEDYTDDD